MNILALGCIHEYEIIRFRELRKDLCGISEKKLHTVFDPGSPEVLPCRRYPLLIILDGRDACIAVFTHQDRRKAHRAADLQDLFGSERRKQDPERTLRLPPYDGYRRPQSLLAKHFEKFGVPRIHGSEEDLHPVFFHHQPSDSASSVSADMICIISVGVWEVFNIYVPSFSFPW